MEPGWLECCSKRKYSPLFSFQKRLRHLKGLSFRKLSIGEKCQLVQLRLIDSAGDLLYESDSVQATSNPYWKNVQIGGKPTSKDVTVQIFADERLILEWRLYFSGLVFISRHLPDASVNFAPNTMLVLFSEGVYCDKKCFNICDKTECNNQMDRNALDGVSVNPEALCDVRCTIKVDARQLKRSYGINSLNRLYTNERAIFRTAYNAHTLRNRLESRINAKSQSASEELQCLIESARVRCKVLRSLTRERLQLQDRENEQLLTEENVLAQKRLQLAVSIRRWDELKQNLLCERETLKQLKRELNSLPLLQRQMALICELDEYIYPVRQVDTLKKFSYSI